MASSSNQSQESRTQIPSRESAPVSSTNFKNQKQSVPSVPDLDPLLSNTQLSPALPTWRDPNRPPNAYLKAGDPKLRYSLRRVSPPSSRSFSLSPQTVESIFWGCHHKVPSRWCPDDRVWSRDFYLSRNSLLKKMFHQSVLARIKIHETEDEEKAGAIGLYICRSLEDCWVTFPIQPPFLPELENEEPPIFSQFFEGYEDEPYSTSIAYVNLPVISTRDSFKVFGDRTEPDYDGVPFPWVTNTTGTKFLDSWSFNSPDREFMRIAGHWECSICGEIWRIEHVAPCRFGGFVIQLGSIGEYFKKYGYECVVRGNVYRCKCYRDGNKSSLRPIISDDLNKINWMVLFLGFGIGFCTIDQLTYYCIQRRLPISHDKKEIAVTVFDDLYQQIFLHRFQP